MPAKEQLRTIIQYLNFTNTPLMIKKKKQMRQHFKNCKICIGMFFSLLFLTVKLIYMKHYLSPPPFVTHLYLCVTLFQNFELHLGI